MQEQIQVTVVEITVQLQVELGDLLILVLALCQVEQVPLLVDLDQLEQEVQAVAEVVHNHNLQALQVVLENLIIDL